jgi:Ser/Thr protein kinase RdoA (MazF antagonist)
MIDARLDSTARAVLSQYDLSYSVLRPLGNRGGFSGAALWRVEGSDGDWCLRAWPPGEMNRERILEIHSLMKLARDQGLLFVPPVLRTLSGSTCMVQADRFWELTAWMPGTATTPTQVTRPQVEAACTALALLHRAWAPAGQKVGPCPAVRRRLQAFQEWEERIRTSCLKFDLHDPAQAWAEQARRLLQGHAAKIPLKLTPWLDRELPLHACLCDVWHDHVLFEGDVVTGLVDYGGVKTDHVAVDLARLLGSLVEDRAELRAAGLEAYARLRPLSLQEEELVSVLDQTGTLVGLITWLKWLYFEDKQFDDRTAVARRLQALVERVEGWNQ